METQPKPMAAIFVEKNGERVWRLKPGSGFPKNEDGTPATQEQFEEFLGLLVDQGIPFFGITAGYTPDYARGETLVLVTNEAQLQEARIQAAQQQAVDDIVQSLRELVESGDVIFS